MTEARRDFIALDLRMGGATYGQISTYFGVSHERARQLVWQAVGKTPPRMQEGIIEQLSEIWGPSTGIVIFQGLGHVLPTAKMRRAAPVIYTPVPQPAQPTDEERQAGVERIRQAGREALRRGAAASFPPPPSSQS